MRLVKIRSWHVIRTQFRGGDFITYCGRIVPWDGATVGDSFGDEKSCESCARIVLMQEKRA